jgi:hypothetical protein
MFSYLPTRTIAARIMAPKNHGVRKTLAVINRSSSRG